jgi:MazG family protein
MEEFQSMVEIMKRLREECPWDRKQDLQSLQKFLIEESFECLEANQSFCTQENKENLKHLIEELGDLLLQILFQAEILSEKTQRVIIREVLADLQDKLVRRHPHVFGEKNALSDADAVRQQWDEIKKQEKQNQNLSESKSALDDLPSTLSALSRSEKIGEKVARVGFDWPTASEVWKQVESERIELQDAVTTAEQDEEWGDLVFSLVQWARHRGISAEPALHRANQKFEKRFKIMESLTSEELSLQRSIEDWEELWRRAKVIAAQDKPV